MVYARSIGRIVRAGRIGRRGFPDGFVRTGDAGFAARAAHPARGIARRITRIACMIRICPIGTGGTGNAVGTVDNSDAAGRVDTIGTVDAVGKMDETNEAGAACMMKNPCGGALRRGGFGVWNHKSEWRVVKNPVPGAAAGRFFRKGRSGGRRRTREWRMPERFAAPQSAEARSRSRSVANEKSLSISTPSRQV